MRVGVIRICLLVAILLLAGTAALSAAGPVQEFAQDAPVSLEADRLSFDEATATYHASGQVRLQKGDLTLLSDEVSWNTATGEAVASGNVRIEQPSGRIAADRLRLNIESGRGLLVNGRVLLHEQNFHLAGEEIEKLGEQSYRVVDGTFTTCDGPSPTWRFEAGRLDVTLGEYARARDVVFYLGDLPVFYTPYFLYPVKTERESGFLMPRYGYSDKRGSELSLAYYRVLARNMDATFYLDYLSDLGVGKGIEYRYILKEDNEGSARVYHISGLGSGDTRYAFDWRHRGTLPEKVRLVADVEYVSSRDYFEDFGEVAEEYNKDQVQSVLFASRAWGRSNLTGQLKYIKDLEQPNDRTLQRLPEIDFTAVRRRLNDTPFYLAFESTYTYFWREEGVKGQRLNLRPSVSAVFHPGRLLQIQPEIGFRQRFYWTSEEGPRFEKESLFDFSTRVSTRFSRVYAVDRKLVKRIRHSIQPEVVYSYIPSQNQEHLPQFDALDDIGPENKITYALINRFIARLEPESSDPIYHEFLYLRLSQDYDIRESRRDPLNSLDQQEPFSDIRIELIARPTRWSYIDIDARYDVNSSDGGFADRFPVFNALGGIRDDAGNALSLDYRYRRDELEYLDGDLELGLLKPVYLGYRNRYDFEDRRTLEQVVDLEYRAQCWSVNLSYRNRLEDREYLVLFALGGIGRVAEFGGSLDDPED